MNFILVLMAMGNAAALDLGTYPSHEACHTAAIDYKRDHPSVTLGCKIWPPIDVPIHIYGVPPT